MTTTTRTDTHRPSAIDPTEYNFVALGYQRCDGIEDAYAIRHNRELLDNFVAATGATWSQHQHGGNCMVCGAHCLYTAIFHHAPTNKLIRTGLDCAGNLDMGDERLFRTFRTDIRDALERKAGKAKAKALLSEAGVGRAWELCFEWSGEEPKATRAYDILCDIVNGTIRRGRLSDKQINFLRKLIDDVDNHDARQAEREAREAAERAASEDCPNGRTKVTGEVLSTRTEDSRFGFQLKMLVRDDRGFKVWGNAPSALQLFDYKSREPITSAAELGSLMRIRTDDIEADADGAYILVDRQRGVDKGDRVEFTATLTRSDRDDKFGFFKRPSKARVLGLDG